jgi:hypothetical protein
MDPSLLQLLLAIIGSTGLFIAVVLVCGFAMNLGRLTSDQRDLIEQVMDSRQRFLINGAGFILFFTIILLIGLGVLTYTLRVAIGDILITVLLILPVLIQQTRWKKATFLIGSLVPFIIYVTAGSIFLLLSIGIRIATTNPANWLELTANVAVTIMQLVIFAIGWGILTGNSRFKVELFLENDQKIEGDWITQNGDQYFIQIDESVVTVNANKVIRRVFRR